MVGPWMNSGRRRSVDLLQRFRSHHPIKKRLVFPCTKTDILNSMDRFNDPATSLTLSTSANTWRPQKFDGLDRFWDQNLNIDQSGNGRTVEPLVIRNPVHSRKLEEPIERKREYWSENLLYVMRREGLIPKNRPVVMDRPTPEEPYRLSANVVRLLEQEPHLYMTKSNIKLSSFDSEISEKTSYDSAESWNQNPFPYSKVNHGTSEQSGAFEDSYNRPHRQCCDCGRGKASELFASEDLAPKSLSFSSLSELRSRQPLYGQSRHYSTTVASRPAQSPRKQRVAYDWDPGNYLSYKTIHVGPDEISKTITRMWLEQRQTPRTYARKLKMKTRLETQMFPNYEFTITGSSANGFGFDNCDVDLNVEFKDDKEPTDGYLRLTILKTMRAHLVGVEDFRRPHVLNAICPILEFAYITKNDRRIIRVDVNANGNVGILNTQLLYSYSRMDPRVAPLVGACKQWASVMNIKDAQKRLLSSYSLTLMVIFFLQNVGVVPVLHRHVPEFESGRGFGKGQKLLLPKWSSSNSRTLGDLFQSMMRFYCDFDFEKHCISVRDGVAIDVDQAKDRDPDVELSAKISSRQTWGFINIQEPFNFTNTARAVFTSGDFKKIKRALELSNEVLPRKGGIDILLGRSKSDLGKKDG